MKNKGKDEKSVWWYVTFAAAYLFGYSVCTDQVWLFGPTFIIMVIAFALRTIFEKEEKK